MSAVDHPVCKVDLDDVPARQRAIAHPPGAATDIDGPLARSACDALRHDAHLRQRDKPLCHLAAVGIPLAPEVSFLGAPTHGVSDDGRRPLISSRYASIDPSSSATPRPYSMPYTPLSA